MSILDSFLFVFSLVHPSGKLEPDEKHRFRYMSSDKETFLDIAVLDARFSPPREGWEMKEKLVKEILEVYHVPELSENYFHLMVVLAESHYYRVEKHSDPRGQRLKALEIFRSVHKHPRTYLDYRSRLLIEDYIERIMYLLEHPGSEEGEEN
ncbi:MAG: hypothetical protein ACMUIE_06540 [Thermoplasmatota archaeon]